jgi:hypothetical protein
VGRGARGEGRGARGEGRGARCEAEGTKPKHQKQQLGRNARIRTHTPAAPFPARPMPQRPTPEEPMLSRAGTIRSALARARWGAGAHQLQPRCCGPCGHELCGGEEAERPTALSLTCPLSVALYPYSFAMEMTLTLGAVRIAYMMAHPMEDRKAWGAAHDGWGS